MQLVAIEYYWGFKGTFPKALPTIAFGKHLNHFGSGSLDPISVTIYLHTQSFTL